MASASKDIKPPRIHRPNKKTRNALANVRNWDLTDAAISRLTGVSIPTVSNYRKIRHEVTKLDPPCIQDIITLRRMGFKAAVIADYFRMTKSRVCQIMEREGLTMKDKGTDPVFIDGHFPTITRLVEEIRILRKQLADVDAGQLTDAAVPYGSE